MIGKKQAGLWSCIHKQEHFQACKINPSDIVGVDPKQLNIESRKDQNQEVELGIWAWLWFFNSLPHRMQCSAEAREAQTSSQGPTIYSREQSSFSLLTGKAEWRVKIKAKLPLHTKTGEKGGERIDSSIKIPNHRLPLKPQPCSIRSTRG